MTLLKRENTRNDALPEGYKVGVPRVSNLVSYVFPFDGTNSELQFRKWLADDVPKVRKRGFAISHEDYMEEASTVGTFIHEQMELFILGKPLDSKSELFAKHHKEIEGGVKYIYNLQQLYPEDVIWLSEPVVRDIGGGYQGSVDIVRVNEKTKTVWIYDYKTWGIAKKRWGIPNAAFDTRGRVKKDLGRFKKVALQLSLYGETFRQKGYSIGGIYVVRIHEEGCFEFSLSSEDFPRQKSNDIRIWSSEEIKTIVSSYKENQKKLKRLAIRNAKIIFNPDSKMILEIRVPLEAYAYVNATIDMYQEKDGKTVDEKIDEARGAIKYYLEGRNNGNKG